MLSNVTVLADKSVLGGLKQALENLKN